MSTPMIMRLNNGFRRLMKQTRFYPIPRNVKSMINMANTGSMERNTKKHNSNTDNPNLAGGIRLEGEVARLVAVLVLMSIPEILMMANFLIFLNRCLVAAVVAVGRVLSADRILMPN